MIRLHDPRTYGLQARAPRSWFSNVEDAFIELATGKAVNTNIIVSPTTPVEHAINDAAAVVLPAAAAIPGVDAAAVSLEAVKQVIGEPPVVSPATAVSTVASTIGSGAETLVNTFLTQHIGTSSTALADAGLEALLNVAASKLSGASNMTEDEVGSAVSSFVAGFTKAA